jgi:UDP-N-acetylmuramate--alanine ligase
VLDLADEIMLLPIYPARELPIEGVTSEMILSKMKNPNTRVVQMNAVSEMIRTKQPSMLITAGAGDIDTLVEPLKNVLAG